MNRWILSPSGWRNPYNAYRMRLLLTSVKEKKNITIYINNNTPDKSHFNPSIINLEFKILVKVIKKTYG